MCVDRAPFLVNMNILQLVADAYWMREAWGPPYVLLSPCSIEGVNDGPSVL